MGSNPAPVSSVIQRGTRNLGSTYYPLNSNFTVIPSNAVSGDISALTSLFPNNFFLARLGFPSDSTADGSSETLQQQFIQAVFSA